MLEAIDHVWLYTTFAVDHNSSKDTYNEGVKSDIFFLCLQTTYIISGNIGYVELFQLVLISLVTANSWKFVNFVSNTKLQGGLTFFYTCILMYRMRTLPKNYLTIVTNSSVSVISLLLPYNK